jgi:heme exporter protein D
MTFQFESLQQMWDMAGHGPYVWTAILVSLFVMGWLLVRPLQQHSAILKTMSQQLRQREQCQKEHQSANTSEEDK